MVGLVLGQGPYLGGGFDPQLGAFGKGGRGVGMSKTCKDSLSLKPCPQAKSIVGSFQNPSFPFSDPNVKRVLRAGAQGGDCHHLQQEKSLNQHVAATQERWLAKTPHRPQMACEENEGLPWGSGKDVEVGEWSGGCGQSVTPMGGRAPEC